MKIIFKNQDNSIVIITPTMLSLYICNGLGDSKDKEVANKSEEEIQAVIESKMDLQVAFKVATPIVAEKDVPYNLPYWIVSADVIPTDRTFRDCWEIDESLGEPNGFGGESNEFDAELLAKYKESLNDKN